MAARVRSRFCLKLDRLAGGSVERLKILGDFLEFFFGLGDGRFDGVSLRELQG